MKSQDFHRNFLRDPTCWLEAHEVEEFLRNIDREFGDKAIEHTLMTEVGLNCYALRSWGVLDSVLRMMSNPEDIFGQPQRILSYFISPAPPVANVLRKDGSVSFDLPLSPEEYPFFSEYLKGSPGGSPSLCLQGHGSCDLENESAADLLEPLSGQSV